MEEKLTGISSQALIYKIRQGENLFLLDVRNEEDHKGWKFELIDEKDQINIPYIEFIEAPEEVIGQVPKDRLIFALCAKGGASDYVVKVLADNGLKAINIAGGMKAFGAVYTHASMWKDKEKEVIQFNRVGKGCLSHLLVSGDEAAIIDPGRHIDHYLEYLLANDLKLKWIFDSHLHADHLSGATALVAATGATYYINSLDMAGAKIGYKALCDGQSCQLGASEVRAESLKSPGHTPGSTVILFGDKLIFTGDDLLISSVGRPDLGGHAKEWAEDLWSTVRSLERFGDDTIVLPAHTQGGAEVDEKGRVMGLLGDLRANNPMLTIDDKEKFLEEILGNLPPEPDSYQKMRNANLGVSEPDLDEQDELELGRNRCGIEQAAEEAKKKSGS